MDGRRRAMAAANATGMTKLALLIDGDNVSATYMPLIMREAEKLGGVAIRRIYGQFASGKMKSWEKHVAEFSLTRVNVSPLTRGKNATDMKLVIEAMDMLHGRQLDVVCIASSDGDFTPIAERMRMNAVAIYGFGAKKAPAGYKKVFDHFFECDTLLAAEKKAAPRRTAAPRKETSAAPAKATPKTPANKPNPAPAAKPAPVAGAKPGHRPRGIPAEIAQRIVAIVDAMEAANRPTDMRSIGNALVREIPEFQVGKYGYGDTKGLLKDVPGLEIVKDGGNSRVRRKAPAGA
jgi:hypothetical protein